MCSVDHRLNLRHLVCYFLRGGYFLLEHSGYLIFKCKVAAQHLCMEWQHGRHFEIMMSNQKSDSVSPCVFTWDTFVPNFIWIRFETTEDFLWNDITATILKVWCHIQNPTPPITLYSLEQSLNPAKFHPDPIWIDRALFFEDFEVYAPNKNNNMKNKITSNIRWVPDPKSFYSSAT